MKKMVSLGWQNQRANKQAVYECCQDRRGKKENGKRGKALRFAIFKDRYLLLLLGTKQRDISLTGLTLF